MTDFVDEFLEQFDNEVYRTLLHMERADYDERGNTGYATHDIGYNNDPSICGRLGTEAVQALVIRALRSLEKLGSVKSSSAQYDTVWRTTMVLDSLAMLPRPGHVDP